MRIIWLPLVLVALSMAACHSEASPTDVDKAADRFFNDVGAGHYTKVYNEAAEDFRQRNAKASVEEDLGRLTGGSPLKEWHRVRMIFDKEGQSRIAVPVYSIYYADWGTAQVDLKFVDVKGDWQLLGFGYRPRPAPSPADSPRPVPAPSR